MQTYLRSDFSKIGFRSGLVFLALVLVVVKVQKTKIRFRSFWYQRPFSNVAPEFHEDGNGLAQGDLNGDGYSDLIGTNLFGEKFNADGARTHSIGGLLMVCMNGGGDSNLITLRLKGDGTGSNDDRIVARVWVMTGGHEGETPKQVQDVLGSSTFLSMNALDLTFGIGGAEEVRTVEVLWPSGRRQILNDLDSNEVVVI